MERRRTIRILNTLVVSCCDAYEGYRTAAQRVIDPNIRRHLDGHALERGEFVEELARAIQRAGGEPHEHGTIRGAIHRGWMALAGQTDPSVLAECLRGEAVALQIYREAAVESIPPDVKKLVERQLGRIAEIHDWLAELLENAD